MELGKISLLWRDYLILSKKSIVLLVVLSAGMGYLLGFSESINWMILGWTLVGTGLMCAGACSLNHVLEADSDARMQRTACRPIPSGRLSKFHGTIFGLTLMLIATFLLLKISLLMLIGGIVTSLLYLFLYTPLKRITTWNTLIGGIPGAMPALGGYLAANGTLSMGAWSLFGVLYCWQQPHFHSIAWMMKHDYAKGGFKMLTVTDPSGKLAFYHTVSFSFLMILSSISIYFFTRLGLFYLIGAIFLGIYFLRYALSMNNPNNNLPAKKVLKASVYYLPLLLLLMLIDGVLARFL